MTTTDHHIGKAQTFIYTMMLVRVLSLLILSASELLLQFLGVNGAEIVAVMALLVLTISLLPTFSLREWVLLLFCFILCVGLWLESSNTESVILALSRAAFFAAFIYLVTLLKEAALRSGSVTQLGSFLTQQPPQRRYFSLAVGGHFLGVLLNFGAISLLTPLIQKGSSNVSKVAKSQNKKSASHVLEQRQICALLRGFSWMIMWSPTALTQAVLYTAIPAANPAVVIPLGIVAAIVMILLGRLEDSLQWKNLKPLSSATVPQFPVAAALKFFLVCGSMIVFTVVTMLGADVSAAHALMLVAPAITVNWVFAQTCFSSPAISHSGAMRLNKRIASTWQTLTTIVFGSSRVLGISAFTLGAAGFIGVAAASLAPVDRLALKLQSIGMPELLFLMCLPLLIIAGGQIALSPILIVVFLSSILNQFPVLPADPNLIVFALGAGWALSMSAAPNASATLLISGVTGIAPTTLTWRWNGRYALLCLLTFFLAFYILSAYF